jgi:hypothetical protein
MATEAQIEANRRNARRSTGPKTAPGRAVSRQNALKHGLSARKLIVFDEKRGDFLAFHDEMLAALAPGDALEAALAERIILCAWRLRRAGRAEAARLNYAAAQRMGHHPGWRTEIDNALSDGEGTIAMIARYETPDRALALSRHGEPRTAPGAARRRSGAGAHPRRRRP